MERLHALADRFAKRRRVVRCDHELLEIDRIVGVLPAVEHVHARDRQEACICAAQIAIEPQAMRVRGRARSGHRHGKNGICPQLGLVGSPVLGNHGRINRPLIRGVQAGHDLADLGVDMAHGLRDALAAVSGFVAVPQLHGFFFAG